MNVTILPSELIGQVTVPASKSEAHRVLIAAALCGEPTEICGRLDGSDVAATAAGLRALGARIDTDSERTVVYPIKELPTQAEIDCRDSGSTLRFLLPTAAALGVKTKFFGTDRLGERPIKELIDALKSGGAQFDGDTLPFTVSGKLTGVSYKINAETSSQYVTGLLIASGIIGGVTIRTEGAATSGDYIKITTDVMKKFGVTAAHTASGYVSKGKFVSPKKITVGGDWSSACFFAAAGAIGDVTVNGVDIFSTQGDKRILDVLTKVGADVRLKDNGVRVCKKELKAFETDVENCPDSAPILAVLAALCEGKSVIRGTGRLKFKESDRGEETVKMLASFGVRAENFGDRLEVYGGKLHGGTVVLPSDHRIAMAAAIAAANTDGESELIGAECVAKSYPDFFIDYIKLGGKADVSV